MWKWRGVRKAATVISSTSSRSGSSSIAAVQMHALPAGAVCIRGWAAPEGVLFGGSRG